MKIKLYTTLFISTLSLSAIANIGAVSTATGGTGRGAVEPVDGILLNPATISDLPKKNFTFNYSADEWALSIADNGGDSYFPAAMQFIKSTNKVLDTSQLGLSFATRRYKKVALGATASVVEYTNYFASGTEQKFRQTTADLAATIAVGENFGIGIVAKKIGASRITLADNLQVQKTTAVGFSYTYQNFARLRFDIESAPENKTDKLVYMLGLENYINDYVVFRLGYQNNKVLIKDYFSAGLGFNGPQFGLHYAYISNVADKTEDKHLIDLGIPF